MRRRAFLVALLATYGCGPNDAPKKGTDANNHARVAAATPPAATREPVGQTQTKIPRVVMLFFGTRDLPAATTSEAATLFRSRLTELVTSMANPSRSRSVMPTGRTIRYRR